MGLSSSTLMSELESPIRLLIFRDQHGLETKKTEIPSIET